MSIKISSQPIHYAEPGTECSNFFNMIDINEETNAKFDKDYFDCPTCGIKNVIYVIESATSEDWSNLSEDSEYYRWGVSHLIVRCTRNDCLRLTYYQLIKDWNKKDVGVQRVNNIILFQYPSGKPELPEYVSPCAVGAIEHLYLLRQ